MKIKKFVGTSKLNIHIGTIDSKGDPKDPNDPTRILIVVDMLLVGYDVPIVQVMYL